MIGQEGMQRVKQPFPTTKGCVGHAGWLARACATLRTMLQPAGIAAEALPQATCLPCSMCTPQQATALLPTLQQLVAGHPCWCCRHAVRLWSHMLEGQLAQLGAICTQQQAAALLLTMVQQGAALLVQQLVEVSPGSLWQARLSADALLVTWVIRRHCQRLGPRCAWRQHLRRYPGGRCQVCMLIATSRPLLIA